MAQKRYKQGPWPPTTDNQPVGYFVTADAYLRSDRSLAGPLRMGTDPGVGPRGRAVVADRSRATDFGMDHIVREFDPMGTALSRYGPREPTTLCAEQIRGRGRRNGY